MSQPVTCLLYKHENLNLDPQDPPKEPKPVVPALGKQGQQETQRLTSQAF